MKTFYRILSVASAAFLMLMASCGDDDDATVRVSSVSLSESSLVLVEGGKAQLKATIYPKDATNKYLFWSSSNELVASVSGGNICALSAGDATIYVTTQDGDKTDSCKVVVQANVVPVQSVSLNFESYEMYVGEQVTLSATIEPANALNKNLVWSSSNEDVAVVKDGVVEVGKEGEAVITVTTEDGSFKAECVIKVTPKVFAFKTLQVEILPSLNYPRSSHIMFYDTNNDLVVVGGHTNGFAPTETAEIYSNGAWKLVSTNFSHDMPFSAYLPSGKVMIGGGCSSSSGVGQSTYVDIYDPSTHSFEPGPSMTISRCNSHAVCMSNGDVVVAGNWYNSDGIEVYSASDNAFRQIASTSQSASIPYVFETSANKAICFGTYSSYGSYFDPIQVTRLDGTAYTPELFSQWIPVNSYVNFCAQNVSIADFTYLLLAKRPDSDSEYRLMKLQGEDFSLVETDMEIPAFNPTTESKIYWGPIVVNKNTQVAYLIGEDADLHHFYVAKIDYRQVLIDNKAKLTFYYSEEMPEMFSVECCCITPDGGIAVSGGIYNSNFSPFSGCYILKPF